MSALSNLGRCLKHAGYAAEYEARAGVDRADFVKWLARVTAFMAGMVALRWEVRS